jgi:hypothetical protein
MADLPPVPPDLVAELEALTDAVAQHPDANVSRKLEYVLDALIMRGQLPASFKRLVSKVRADRSTVRLAVFVDKYTVDNAEVDCESRIPLCGARCCSFNVTLSEQDVLERKLPFDLQKPYELPRDPDTKRCVCMDENRGCTVYDVRPGICRTYDCRDDRRVWIDFAARIPAPMPDQIKPSEP